MSSICKKNIERESNVDLIRVMACLIVIGVHCNLLTDASDVSQTLWRVLLGDGVTYFFFVMGFFLFKERAFVTTLKNVFFRIMIPTFGIMFLLRLFYPFLSAQQTFIGCITTPVLNLKEYIKSIFNWSPGAGIEGYLWYPFTYLQVVMLVPIMKLFCRQETEGRTLELVRYYVIGINLLGLVLVDMMALVRIPFTAEPYKMLTVPASFAIAGYSLYYYKDWLKNHKIIRIPVLIITIVLEVVRWRLQILLFQVDEGNTKYLFWDTSFSFCTVAGVIILILTLHIKEHWIKRVITFLGSKTFYVYLLHYPIQYAMDARGFSEKVINFLSGTKGYMTDGQELLYILVRIGIIFCVALVCSICVDCAMQLLKRIILHNVKRGE